MQLEDPADATDCLDDFIKLIEEICNVYPEQGRGLTNRIGNNTTSNTNSGNGSMINVNVGNVENTTIGNGWEVFLRFLWDKISSASTDSMIYIHLFLPFLSMLTAMARDSKWLSTFVIYWRRITRLLMKSFVTIICNLEQYLRCFERLL